MLGDLVSKGPASPRALGLARELGALAVRGNHDDAALAAYDYSRKHGGALPRLSKADTGGEDFGFVRNLTKADAKFLREMPWTLHIPFYDAVAVHAGLVPGVAVNEQRLSDTFTIRGVIELDDDGGSGGGNFVERVWRWLLRSLVPDSPEIDAGRRGSGTDKILKKRLRRRVYYRATSAVGEGIPLAKAWSSFPSQEKHVVFGHDARAGLQLEKMATGIDTGCVAGGELTALVLPSLNSLSFFSSMMTTTVTAASDDAKNDNEKFASASALEGRWPIRGVELVSVECRGAQKIH